MDAKIFLLNSSTPVAWPLSSAGPWGNLYKLCTHYGGCSTGTVFPHAVKAQALKCNCNAARVRFAKIWERDMMFAWTSCSCSLFEFTSRKNAILNLGGACFALMFLWIVCKELGLSYFVVQPHGFKRKLDEVKCSKCSGTWACLLRMQCCCLSRDSRARESMKTAERGKRD